MRYAESPEGNHIVRRILGLSFAQSALMSCLGITLIFVAVWLFAIPIFSDLQTGHATLVTSTKTHITWSHVYVLREQPLYFSVKLLTDASGTIAFGGLGMLLLYVVVRRTRDPAGANVGTRAKNIETLWAVGCLVPSFCICFCCYFLTCSKRAYFRDGLRYDGYARRAHATFSIF